jgi:hypothetical protein
MEMSGQFHAVIVSSSRKEPLVLGDMRLARLRGGGGGSGSWGEEKYLLLLPGIEHIFLSLVQPVLCDSV